MEARAGDALAAGASLPPSRSPSATTPTCSCCAAPPWPSSTTAMSGWPRPLGTVESFGQKFAQ
eukprot:2597497-Alexandrium_andersonii.AAC.1